MPLVSILMTAFNREDFIRQAIESVLGSTYTNFELIINDDCSSDKTLNIAKEYEEKDSRIKVFQNSSNLKDYPNRNKTASYAKGKYIKYLDSDDAIYPDGLAYCVNAMESQPTAAMGVLFFQKQITEEENVLWQPSTSIRHHFLKRGFLNIGPSGTIFRRDIFEKLGGFDTRFGVASDGFFNIRLASLFPVMLLPKVFFYYRVHDGQEIKDKIGYLQNNHLYLKELVENNNLPLAESELLTLKKRVEKSFSKESLKFLFKTRDIKSFLAIIRTCGYSIPKILKGLF